jgi:hypothetical protein
MVLIRTRTFCFCLPVRLGIFTVTILDLLVGGSLSIVGWIAVKHLDLYPLSQQGNIALYVQTIMFTLLAFLSILGFVATATNRSRLLFLYGMMLVFHLPLSIASGVLSIHTVFQEDWSEKCSGTANDAEEPCRNETTIFGGIVTAFFIVFWLFQIYGYILVANLVEQINEEHDAPSSVQQVKDSGASFPVTTYNSYAGTNYSFTRPPNSYDARGHSMA